MKKMLLKAVMAILVASFGFQAQAGISETVSTFLAAKGAKAGLASAALISLGLYLTNTGRQIDGTNAVGVPSDRRILGYACFIASLIPAAYGLGQYYS